jgi:hypothetical protein
MLLDWDVRRLVIVSTNANFEVSLCDAYILKITTLLMYIEKATQALNT